MEQTVEVVAAQEVLWSVPYLCLMVNVSALSLDEVEALRVSTLACRPLQATTPTFLSPQLLSQHPAGARVAAETGLRGWLLVELEGVAEVEVADLMPTQPEEQELKAKSAVRVGK